MSKKRILYIGMCIFLVWYSCVYSQAAYMKSDSLKKHYSFDGSTAVFFGDSITIGMTTDYVYTENTYPELFSRMVGMTYKNEGMVSAVFSKGKEYHPSIEATIEESDLNVDYIFIAGGINDWIHGVELNEFEKSLKNTCKYLKKNFKGLDVIFITPINHAAWDDSNVVASVNDYRKIITKVARNYKYSVIDGSSFGFPNSPFSGYEEYLFDGLHPTEYGYLIYAAELYAKFEGRL